jgi:virginiamycin B lyase
MTNWTCAIGHRLASRGPAALRIHANSAGATLLVAGALVLCGFIALTVYGCGAAPPPAAMNQLGNRVEAGRATSTPAFAHPPSDRAGIHSPYAIAAGSGGIWFTEYSAPMLGMMEPAGAFKQVDLDQDGFPERLTIARDGAVWFTDPQANRIGRILPYNDRVDYYIVPTPKSGPAGIAATRDGSIWFAEHAANQIAIFVPAGRDPSSPGHHGFKEFPLPLGGEPAGIATAADGSLWFAENSGNRIGRIRLTHNGGEAGISEFPLPVPHSHPNGVAVGGDGDVYFTELAASRIGKVTPQGLISEMVLPVNGPALDIVAAGEGTIWMTVPKAHAICRLQPGTPITAFFLPNTAIPAFIAGGADGNLYFTEPTGKIARFTPLGVMTEFKLAE